MTTNIENIEDHLARICDCGSVHYNLLKSGYIECSKCGQVFSKWEENTDEETE